VPIVRLPERIRSCKQTIVPDLRHRGIQAPFSPSSIQTNLPDTHSQALKLSKKKKSNSYSTVCPTMDNGNNSLEAAKQQFGDKINGLKNLKWEHIPAPVRGYIERHPHLTAIQLVLILLTLAPGLIVAPALGVLGFSSIGPVAGEQNDNKLWK
jgi:hypothetical protein